MFKKTLDTIADSFPVKQIRDTVRLVKEAIIDHPVVGGYAFGSGLSWLFYKYLSLGASTFPNSNLPVMANIMPKLMFPFAWLFFYLDIQGHNVVKQLGLDLSALANKKARKLHSSATLIDKMVDGVITHPALVGAIACLGYYVKFQYREWQYGVRDDVLNSDKLYYQYQLLKHSVPFVMGLSVYFFINFASTLLHPATRATAFASLESRLNEMLRFRKKSEIYEEVPQEKRTLGTWVQLAQAYALEEEYDKAVVAMKNMLNMQNHGLLPFSRVSFIQGLNLRGQIRALMQNYTKHKNVGTIASLAVYCQAFHNQRKASALWEEFEMNSGNHLGAKLLAAEAFESLGDEGKAKKRFEEFIDIAMSPQYEDKVRSFSDHKVYQIDLPYVNQTVVLKMDDNKTVLEDEYRLSALHAAALRRKDWATVRPITVRYISARSTHVLLLKFVSGDILAEAVRNGEGRGILTEVGEYMANELAHLHPTISQRKQKHPKEDFVQKASSMQGRWLSKVIDIYDDLIMDYSEFPIVLSLDCHDEQYVITRTEEGMLKTRLDLPDRGTASLISEIGKFFFRTAHFGTTNKAMMDRDAIIERYFIDIYCRQNDKRLPQKEKVLLSAYKESLLRQLSLYLTCQDRPKDEQTAKEWALRNIINTQWALDKYSNWGDTRMLHAMKQMIPIMREIATAPSRSTGRQSHGYA